MGRYTTELLAAVAASEERLQLRAVVPQARPFDPDVVAEAGVAVRGWPRGPYIPVVADRIVFDHTGPAAIASTVTDLFHDDAERARLLLLDGCRQHRSRGAGRAGGSLASSQIWRPGDRLLQLIFVHIPKTAGTSLRTIIAQNFLPWNIEQMYAYGRHAERVQEIAQRTKRGGSVAVLGHVGYGVHRSVGLDDPQYVTMLREPVDRVISMYRHIRRDHAHQFHDAVSDMSLEDYVSSGIDESASNSQTRFLSGAKWDNELAGHDDAVNFAGRTEEQALAEALAALDRMTVGISERFLESVVVLAHHLHLRWTYWRRLNVADPLSEPISGSARKVVREANRLDELLYQRALEVHQEQYRQVPHAGRRITQLERQHGPIARWATRFAERSLTWSH